MNKRYGIIWDTDSYKNTHHNQYPPGTTSMFSYVESRGGLFPKTLSFGLQYYLKEYLTTPITLEDVQRADKKYTAHMGSFWKGWYDIVKYHGGLPPVRIRAVPEGTLVPTHNALITIESTDPRVFPIVSLIETSLVRNAWSGTNVATISYNAKQIIKVALEKSSDDPKTEINFKLHDFGSRGCSSQESAMVGGAAHLINFMGTDTFTSIPFLEDSYHQEEMPGFSIPAMEHSSITSWGREHEVDAYRNMLNQYAKPGTIVACVSDSYDLWNAESNLWGGELKQQVIDSGATIVIRPDSGNPPDVVLKSAQLLDEKFGHTINSKGYKVLKNVRIIQGDGLNLETIKEILDKLLANGYSATNIAFGMGGALLQQHNRDTQKFAMKCSHIYRDGKDVLVYKDPITDHGKRSKAGRLDLIRVGNAWRDKAFPGDFETVVLSNGEVAHERSVMRTVYENGKLLIDDNFEEIRNRANKS
jgi:nicotinamide phosphoribosyltransferase